MIETEEEMTVIAEVTEVTVMIAEAIEEIEVIEVIAEEKDQATLKENLITVQLYS